MIDELKGILGTDFLNKTIDSLLKAKSLHCGTTLQELYNLTKIV